MHNKDVVVVAGNTIVTVPAAAVPSGTKITVAPTSTTLPRSLQKVSAAIHTLGKPIKLRLGDDLQPRMPLRFSAKIPKSQVVGDLDVPVDDVVEAIDGYDWKNLGFMPS